MTNKTPPTKLNPALTLALTLFHGITIYGFYLLFCGEYSLQLFFYQIALTYLAGFTFGTGDYGMWAHQAALSPSRRAGLMILHTFTLQGPLYFWARVHRLHHKQSDGAEDAQNAIRGVVYSHIGWLLCFNEKQFHKDLASAKIREDDIRADKIVMWQSKNYYWMSAAALGITCFIPVLMGWEQSIWHVLVAALTGVVINLHVACWTNMWGTKSFERSIGPVVHEIIHFLTYGMGRVC
ncbi:unnamed protein product [Allacma fusca]|uniref:Uncharacterized protein n=1 Tax=Allacma fusca TaxID=39272 RepID=A0A8J2K7I7_9HEXA|nr:unnamed protein product [Allacma fusca]